MENATRIAAETAAEPLMLRANRKVIGGRCSICNEGFKLAEETYSCPFCSGYHHAACWQTHRTCPSQGSMAETTFGDANGTQLDKTPKTDTQALVASATKVAEGERRCPSCTKGIQREALKCRFCGYIFDREYAQTAEEIPRELAKQIESYANKSLTKCVLGIVFCGFLAPIFGGMAISNGSDARRLLDEYPSYRSQTSAGGKALAGIIIGWVEIIGFVLIFLAGVSGGR